MLNQQEHFGPPRSEMGKLSTAFATGGLFLFMITARDEKGRIARDLNYDWKESFWKRVDKNGPVQGHCPELGPCWAWTGGKDKHGYGIVTFYNSIHRTRRRTGSHRLASFLGTGKWPDAELEVMHRCDNPNCNNPAHLILGTHHQNMADAKAKGRMRPVGSPGESNPAAKFTLAIVEQIREEKRVTKMGNLKLSKKYGCSKTQMRRIVNGESWAIPQP